MVTIRSLRPLAAATMAVAALTTACGGGSGADLTGDRPSVRVLLDWFPNPDHIGLYTAQKGGYFAAEHLKVTFTPPSNAADPLKLVATGQVPLGISYEPDILIAKSQGLNVTAVAAVIPVALNSLIAPDTSPVRTPAQLAGHTIGTPGLPSDDVYLDQVYQKYGIRPSSVKKVNVGTNLVSSMLSRKVDATVGGYRNIEAVQLRDRGLRPMVVPVTDAGVPPYNELVLVANSAQLRGDAAYRAAVRRFIAALAKGTAKAIRSPAAARRAMTGVAKGYEPAHIGKMIVTTAPLLKNPRGFGYMDPHAWQSFSDWMHRRGLIKTGVRAGSVATNAYLRR